ncbi:hypothetical protein [Flexibacterium corallicola]|uniref:hypothetical protein n=1 Tax=Flexibacterium corallicola TaxID=3037259 RepID=UPI00286EEDDE|nr:hypothetical protein [Pseudovibrio sp. M1P-2-3]
MIWKHYRNQRGGDRDFVELLSLTQKHGQEAVEMACELALDYKTTQLSAILALLYDLTEPALPKQIPLEGQDTPALQMPPVANCGQYDLLLQSPGEHL